MIEARPTVCPRCGSESAGEEYYGVCGDCRAALRAQYSGGDRAVDVADYEPKRNVTPNAVASKD